MPNRCLSQQAFLCLVLFCGLIFIPRSCALTIITDCVGLQAISNNLTGSYQLSGSIDCSATTSWNGGAGFMPLGNNSSPFLGSFDGRGFTISGLTINRNSTDFVGLFGSAGSNARINSIGLLGGFITGRNQVGGLVGNNNGGTVNNAYTTSKVSGSITVGGLVAQNIGTISNGYATGNVSASGGSFSYVGGLAGNNLGAIINGYAIGSVFSPGNAVGGLVGYSTGIINDAYATGSVVGTNDVGGLVGWNSGGTIISSYATGSVSGSGNVGGLTGQNDGTVINAYATSSVSGSNIVGGLIGLNDGTVNNAYASGLVLGSNNIGGLVGNKNTASVISAYWDTQTSQQALSVGGVGLSTALMQQENSFLGWDFVGTWSINPARQYPFLQVFISLPVLSTPLPNVTANINDLLEFPIPSNSFMDPEGLQLEYTAAMLNKRPFPPWLLFDAPTQTFLGTPLSGSQGVLNIVVTAYATASKFVSDVFQLTIPNSVPVVQTTIPPQQALNGQFFEFIISGNVFFDADGDHLLLIATTVNGQTWPAWLNFNALLGIFSGTSILRGTYTINVTANDNFGGQVSTQFNIVTPNTAPKVVASFPNQVLMVGAAFSFALPSGSFIDIDGDPMAYNAVLFGGAALLPWLNFNSNALSFSGAPNSEGFLMVAVTATDTYNASTSLYFGITVLATVGNAPPVLVIRMQDQTEIVGKNMQLFLPTGMFIDPNGYTLTYSATLSDGSALPNWLTFNTTELVFTGVSTTVTTIKINVAVTNGHGGSAQNAFNLMTQASQPPVLTNQLPNQQVVVGADFSYTVPDNTFYDASGAHLIYTATRLGGGSLPGWLKFDASTRVFSGKPKPTDTNTYAAKTSTIQVCASDGQEKSCTNFDLSVTGQSPLAQAITAIISIASALSTLYGIYRNQAWIWNTFATRKYKKPSQKVSIGDSFSHQFSLSSKVVKNVRVFDAHKNPLHDDLKLIDWMKFDRSSMTISGAPTSAESFWICAQGNPGYWWCAKGNFGFNLEAFMLHVVDPNGTTSMTPLKEMADV